MPASPTFLDYEAELAIVIGTRCRHVPAERAHEVIAGYTCANDVSVRDWQGRAQTMTIGKSFDTHGPLGPWLVTADELATRRTSAALLRQRRAAPGLQHRARWSSTAPSRSPTSPKPSPWSRAT